jgi:hypothetical protein
VESRDKLILGISTIFIAAFTALLACGTLLLFFATRNLVKGAEETAQKQLRAYVYVSSIDIIKVDSDTGPETTIVIKNSGQTPAYKATHANVFYWTQFPLKKPVPPIPFDVAGDGGSVFELGPGDSSVKPKRRSPLSAAAIAGLKDGTFILYLYGEIRYTDAFNQPRWTRYKAMLGGPLADRGPNLARTADGNESN